MKGFTFSLSFLRIISVFLAYYYVSASASKASIRKAATAKQFQRALNRANPGDIIKLASNDIFFEGFEFIASKSGKAGSPITITGAYPDASAVIELNAYSNSSGTTGLTISGDYWVIKGIELVISKPHVGLRIEGNNNYLSSIIVTGYETGVYLSGSGNTILNSNIKSTRGTGLYVKGDGQSVTSNYVQGSDWSIYLSDTSCCGEISSNTVKGPMLVQGSDYYLEDNEIKGDLLVLNCKNQFADIVVHSKNPPSFPDNCHIADEGVVHVQ